MSLPVDVEINAMERLLLAQFKLRRKLSIGGMYSLILAEAGVEKFVLFASSDGGNFFEPLSAGEARAVVQAILGGGEQGQRPSFVERLLGRDGISTRISERIHVIFNPSRRPGQATLSFGSPMGRTLYDLGPRQAKLLSDSIDILLED